LLGWGGDEDDGNDSKNAWTSVLFLFIDSFVEGVFSDFSFNFQLSHAFLAV
jgi:hypothetical protein